MRRIYSIIAGLLLITNVFAQAPQKMSYQAIIRNSSNVLITSTLVGIQISILQGSPSGTAVYVETQTSNSNANGLVSIEIGGGTVVSGTFTSIDWANGPYFIKTETDPTGGISYSIIGTNQLLSVPYALYAANAGNAIGGGNFLHYIGEQFGGGVIFHLWKDAQGIEHGLIVDKTDLSALQTWSNISQTIGLSAQSNWDGLSNSNAIVGQAGHTNSAASLCLNSTNGGQSDWYLPSRQELIMLWNNYYTVERSISQIAGATQLQLYSLYWSSTERSIDGNANLLQIEIGSLNNAPKASTYAVRAVRAF